MKTVINMVIEVLAFPLALLFIIWERALDIAEYYIEMMKEDNNE